jgi:ribonuclease P protein component
MVRSQSEKVNKFSKQERLCGTMLIDRLFREGNRQIAVFPIRLVWLMADDIDGVQILVSAPKRNFHHAVDRNRIKRQIREFYRTSAATLKDVLADKGKGLALAFLFNDVRLWDTSNLVPRLETAMDKLIQAVSESCANC